MIDEPQSKKKKMKQKQQKKEDWRNTVTLEELSDRTIIEVAFTRTHHIPAGMGYSLGGSFWSGYTICIIILRTVLEMKSKEVAVVVIDRKSY